MRRVPQGLYAITSATICASQAGLLAAVAAALRGGAALVQYRDKDHGVEARRQRAGALLALCRAHRVPLIVNDDPQLAADIGADGVHLGRGDAPLAEARRLLGPDALIGVTCGSDVERACAAAAQGADYVAFGRFHDSRTKPLAPPADPAVLTRARALLPQHVSICAIGGITPDHAPPLVQRGADLIAAVEGVFGAGDIASAARAYGRCFPVSF